LLHLLHCLLLLLLQRVEGLLPVWDSTNSSIDDSVGVSFEVVLVVINVVFIPNLVPYQWYFGFGTQVLGSHLVDELL
jgi:hypothetical protein